MGLLVKRLYTVTVETEFVFASDSEDIPTVLNEFEDALREELGMRDELEEGNPTVSSMAHLPARYSLSERAWGDNSDSTIGELIEAGAAPKYTELQEAFARLGKKP